jgi:asparagine synthase (glutamine-hydrolysing)
MNVTRHGGVLYRKAFKAPSDLCRDLGAHLSGLDPRSEIRSVRVSDVTMCVAASGQFASSKQTMAVNGKVLLAWDGRLDNRSTLAGYCKIKADDSLGDAALVAEAYSAIGPALWSILIGDYALACWDVTTQQLYLARDSFGTRPLYYYADDATAIWASELTYFVELLGDSLELDDGFMASFLLAMEVQPRTPYRDICSVLPGYVTVISKDAVRHQQLWNVASCPDVRLASDSDYEARFRDLFAQSVERRLRTPGLAIAELSGGLDSSSIVCMADQLLQASKEKPARVATVSYLYDGSRTADEREFIKEVEQVRGVTTHFIRDRNILALSIPPRAARPSGLHLFYETHRAFEAIIESLNATILLSGFGGDEVTINNEPVCPDLPFLLKRGRPRAAFRAARTWAQVHKTTFLEMLWTHGLLPLLPLGIQTAMAPETFFPKSWMGPALVERLGLWKRHVSHGLRSSSDPVRRRQTNALSRARSFTSQCYYREQGCCDASYPFLDRDLIEFLLGMPNDQKLRPTESRSIQRRALKGVLPEKIRLRNTKQGPEEPLMRALSESWPDLKEVFRDAEVYKRGYIDGRTFFNDLTRARHGICRFTASLARVLSLELWLQAQCRERPGFSRSQDRIGVSSAFEPTLQVSNLPV